jgi:hypothetical protein
LKAVKQLHSGLSHRIGGFTKLIGVPDGEFYPINRDANLICHLKFDCRGARRGVGLDGLINLTHYF